MLSFPCAVADKRAAAAAAKPVPKPLPEVHILGEITGGTGFGSSAVCCKWSVESGDKWEWLGGHRSGQTHTVHPEDGSEFSVWSHPLDVHFAAGTMSVSCLRGARETRWPRAGSSGLQEGSE